MRLLTSCIAVVAASQLGATDCGGGITRDPGFDLWCGEELCAWKLERGSIHRVPTWHQDDAGVELLDPDTAIEQFTPVDSRDGTCIRFDLISDVAEGADVALVVDVYGDGSVERTFEIPAAHWRSVSYAFAVKPPFTGIRFEITKRSQVVGVRGRAAVARMRAVVDDDGCEGVAPLDGGPAPLGAVCEDGSECASGVCWFDFFRSGRCTGCDPDAPACAADEVCGVAEPGPAERAVPLACVAAHARVLGEQCLGNNECATGICTFGRCSTCDDKTACGSTTCLQSYVLGPFLCGGGLNLAERGAPCAADHDCASGACRGPLRQQCIDGRSCANDANCPVDFDLKPTTCAIVGIQGGTCD
jgi:hypothetical protein